MLYGLLIFVFVIICILIVVITLIQPHYEEGFGGLMGGASPDSFFGVKGNITAIKITAILGIIFFALALIINKIPSGKATSTIVGKTTKVVKEERKTKKETRKTVKAEPKKTKKSSPNTKK